MRQTARDRSRPDIAAMDERTDREISLMTFVVVRADLGRGPIDRSPAHADRLLGIEVEAGWPFAFEVAEN
jgi:hypothetical protein